MLLLSQDRMGGWAKVEAELKKELTKLENIARKYGRLPRAGGSDFAPSAAQVAMRKRKVDQLSAPLAATTPKHDETKRLKALSGLDAGDQRTANVVAKLMDKILTHVDKGEDIEVRSTRTMRCLLPQTPFLTLHVRRRCAVRMDVGCCSHNVRLHLPQ